MKSLASAAAEKNKGEPQILWSFPIADPLPLLPADVILRQAMANAKLHTKFEVASCIRCRNNKGHANFFVWVWFYNGPQEIYAAHQI